MNTKVTSFALDTKIISITLVPYNIVVFPTLTPHNAAMLAATL